MCQKSPERRKVGDTLRAIIEDADGNEINIDDLEGATVQWFAGNEEIDEADDIELVVGDELIGLQIFVEVTDAEGNVYESDATEPVEENNFGVIEIESAEATKVNEIEVALAYSVDPDEVAVTVVRGTNTVNVDDIDWSDDYDSLTITTSANMSEGTYTVTITDIEDETNTDSADFEVEGRKVTDIIITNDIAYTSANKLEAYAYYDVLDQYGESMRKSASVQWTGSCVPNANKSTGKITLTKTDGSAWTYNDQIYLTGVYTKTGITCQKTLTVGTEQSMDKVELKGFVKRGTTTIIDTLPAGFTDNTYYLIYTTVDQNGDALPVGSAAGAVTFVSDNVLVVDEIGTPILNGLVIAGDEYEASFVSPGIKVADGGTVTVTAIATKTGSKSELTFDVTPTSVIQSFSFAEPSGVVADGDQDVEIPFTALDVDGNEVTDFDTIAKQRTFNELTLNASEGTLELKEEDDGTATLLWSDRPLTWNGDSFNGIDRPVNLSAVVVGGDSDNIMLSVQDARRPDTIAAIDTNSVEVEGAAIPFSLASFSYYDQYGDLIGDDFGDDNGFFEYAKANIAGSSNTDFNGYTFGVRVKYAGSNNLTYDTTAKTGTVYANNTPDPTTNQLVIVSNATTFVASTSAIEFETKTTIDDVATGEGFKFEIVKTNVNTNKADGKAANWESASPEKYSALTVVDITQLRNLTITELPMLYLGPVSNSASGAITGSGVMATGGAAITDVVDTATGGLFAGGAYTPTVEVTGTYEGESVTVPESYYHVSGSKISDGLAVTAGIANPGTGFDGELDTLVAGGLKAEHLYDKTTANYTSKNTTDTVKAQVQKIYGKTASAVAFYTDATAVSAGATALNSVTDTYTYNTVTAGAATTALYAAYNAANTAIDSATLANFATGSAAAVRAELKALNLGLLVGELTFDTASTTVTLSDQAPKNAAIKNVADAYTLNPTLTNLGTGAANDMLAILNATQDDAIEVVDQYDVTRNVDITMRATDLAENEEGKKSNNLTVSGNDTTKIQIVGAELGDTFTLVLSAGSVSATTKITVGADTAANIIATAGGASANNYRDALLPLLV